MIVWLNGTHWAGKTTTSAFVQQLRPDARVFDAEKVGEVLIDIKPGPMTVLVECYWREISGGLTERGIPIHHVVLHADQAPLRDRILNDEDLGPSTFRFAHLEPYAEAAHTWLHNEDPHRGGDCLPRSLIRHITAELAGQQIANSVLDR